MGETEIRCRQTLRGIRGKKGSRSQCQRDATYWLGTAKVPTCAECAAWFPEYTSRQLIEPVSSSPTRDATFDVPTLRDLIQGLFDQGEMSAEDIATNIVRTFGGVPQPTPDKKGE